MRLRVATIAGPHGLRGHLKLIVHTDDPARRFSRGVVLDCDWEEHPTLTVAEVSNAGSAWRVKFEEIADRTAAEEMLGAELWIETEEWEDEDDEWYDADLVGLPARSPDGGALGEVVAVEHGPAQDLLVVRHDGRDVRVPFVAAIVTEVSGDGVTIAPPGGLFDSEVDD